MPFYQLEQINHAFKCLKFSLFINKRLIFRLLSHYSDMLISLISAAIKANLFLSLKSHYSSTKILKKHYLKLFRHTTVNYKTYVINCKKREKWEAFFLKRQDRCSVQNLGNLNSPLGSEGKTVCRKIVDDKCWYFIKISILLVSH